MPTSVTAHTGVPDPGADGRQVAGPVLRPALARACAGGGDRAVAPARAGAVGVGVIERVLGWEALDSRGTPTVGCIVRLEGGAEGEAIVPSGASTGRYEAHERRDGDERYGGKGVRGAVAALRDEIGPLLVGRDAADQEELDAALRALDGTPDLSRLGANAVLAASVACALAAARSQGLPLWQLLAPGEAPLLPLPMVNVISGGAHAGRVIDVQDFLVVPVGASSFGEAVEWAGRVRAATAEELRLQGHEVALGRRRGRPRRSAGLQPGGARRAHRGNRAQRSRSRRRGGDRGRRRGYPARRGGRLRARERGPVAAGGRAGGGDGGLERGVPDRLDRGRARRGRRRGMGPRHRPSRGPHPGAGRRSLRHLAGAAARRHPGRGGECGAREAEPGRHPLRRASRGGDREGSRLRHGALRPLRRDRGRLARRPRGRLAHRPDQGRLDDALRAHRQVEPPPAHRGRAARRRIRRTRFARPTLRRRAGPCPPLVATASASRRRPRVRRYRS